MNIAVTGIGVVSPAGVGVEPLARAMAQAAAAGAPVAGAAAFGRQALARAGDRVDRMDRSCQLALVAALCAHEQSGLKSERTAVVFGSAYASLLVNQRFFEKIVSRGARFADPKRFPYTSPNVAGGEVSIALQLKGPNVSLTSGWHSGLSALVTACDFLTLGHADSALVVAADAVGPVLVDGLRAEGLLSVGAAEAAAAIVVETERSARDRGATLLARLSGAGEAFGPGALSALLDAAAHAAFGTANHPPLVAEEREALGARTARSLAPGLGEAFAAAGLIGVALAATDAPAGKVAVTALCPYGGRAAITIDPAS